MYIKSASVPVKGHSDIAKVATISAKNNPQIGEILADAMDKVGKEGVIEVEEGKSMETELTVVEGMQFDKGYISPLLYDQSRYARSGARRRIYPAARKEALEHPRTYPPLGKNRTGSLRLSLLALETFCCDLSFLKDVRQSEQELHGAWPCQMVSEQLQVRFVDLSRPRS